MSQIICSHVEYKQTNYSYFGRVYLERGDTLFALLGGGPHPENARPCFALRDIPADANILTSMAFYLLVRDDETDRERSISRRAAEQWVEQGSATWAGANHITDPDYFSPSWLLTEELEQVYRKYQERDAPSLLSVAATLAAMRLLPGARLVYWFGN